MCQQDRSDQSAAATARGPWSRGSPGSALRLSPPLRPRAVPHVGGPHHPWGAAFLRPASSVHVSHQESFRRASQEPGSVCRLRTHSSTCLPFWGRLARLIFDFWAVPLKTGCAISVSSVLAQGHESLPGLSAPTPPALCNDPVLSTRRPLRGHLHRQGCSPADCKLGVSLDPGGSPHTGC